MVHPVTNKPSNLEWVHKATVNLLYFRKSNISVMSSISFIHLLVKLINTKKIELKSINILEGLWVNKTPPICLTQVLCSRENIEIELSIKISRKIGEKSSFKKLSTRKKSVISKPWDRFFLIQIILFGKEIKSHPID